VSAPRNSREQPVLRDSLNASLGRVPFALLLLGALAAVFVLVGFMRDPDRAFHAYLAAYAFALSLALGSLAFTMIAHAANATWPVAVRRLPEAAAFAMPALALLFVPILFGLHALYPWARPETYAEPIRALLEHRRPVLNPTGFTIRAFAYLGVWSALAWGLRHYSLAMDQGADAERCGRTLRRWSYAGLPVASLTAGFAAYEWFMSLSIEFASTMFSALWIAMCLHAGVACTVLLVEVAQRGTGEPLAGPSHVSALGRLLFAFLIFLGYTAFFQYLLVWMGNRPSEAEWYLQRAHGPYRSIATFLIFGEFALPFLLLLSYRLKRNLRVLSAVAVWCLGALYVHINWLITPSARAPGLSWLDPVALVAVLGLSSGIASYLQSGRQLAPIADPKYPAALRYESH
jgi:hypothetical protein